MHRGSLDRHDGILASSTADAVARKVVPASTRVVRAADDLQQDVQDGTRVMTVALGDTLVWQSGDGTATYHVMIR